MDQHLKDFLIGILNKMKTKLNKMKTNKGDDKAFYNYQNYFLNDNLIKMLCTIQSILYYI